MNITEIITLAFAIVGASHLALKYIAPLTQTKVDDKIYHILEEILKIFSLDKQNKIVTIFKGSTDAIKIKLRRD